MVPVWKEVMSFDIEKATDVVEIIVYNNYSNQKEQICNKVFRVDGSNLDEFDDLRRLSD